MGGIRKLFGLMLGGAAAWAFAVKPRVFDKPDLSDIRRYDYARRGLFDLKRRIPENSLAAVENAMDHGYGIALDVRLTADGVPVVFRDDRLYRMTGTPGTVSEMQLASLKEMRLDMTDEQIPTLNEALALIAGKVPVIIEIHSGGESTEALCRQICGELDAYEGVFAVMSFDPRVLRWFRGERNEYIRGQVVDYGRASGYTVRSCVWDLFCNSLFMNFMTEPDLIAASVSTRYNPSLWICRLLYRVPLFTWDVHSIAAYEDAKIDGATAIFEGIEP